MLYQGFSLALGDELFLSLDQSNGKRLYSHQGKQLKVNIKLEIGEVLVQLRCFLHDGFVDSH